MLPTPKGRRFFVRPASAMAALALIIALAGCGSASERRLDTADASSLQGLLAHVRASAQRGDRAAALAGLVAVRTRVERLQATGALPTAEASALRTGIARAIAAAEREIEPASEQTIAAAEPPPAEVIQPHPPGKHPKHPEHPHGPKDHPPPHGHGAPGAHGAHHGEGGGPGD